jgi:hypothetical protein
LVKDVIAYVSTWEEESLKHLPAILDARSRHAIRSCMGGSTPLMH